MNIGEEVKIHEIVPESVPYEGEEVSPEPIPELDESSRDYEEVEKEEVEV